MNVFSYGEKKLFILVIISNWVHTFKSFLIIRFKFVFVKLNINQFFKNFFTTWEPHNKLMETDSKNQIWNNALCKDDIEKIFGD
jgi:hypothetical protein